MNNSTDDTAAGNESGATADGSLSRTIDGAGSAGDTSSGDGPGFGVLVTLLAAGLTFLAGRLRATE